jgi:predicted dehydrogenase
MRIGLVGCGNWGRHILRDLRQLDPDGQVVVVARSPASRARAREGGAHSTVAKIDALTDCQGIVVATPTTTHADVLWEALKFNAHVFVEKPLTCDGPSAAHLAGLFPKYLFVMDKWRYHPGVEMIRDITKTGELGPLTALRVYRLGNDDRKSDTDALWHLLPHDLAIVYEITGSHPVPVKAHATVQGEAVAVDVRCEGDIQISVSSVSKERKRAVEASYRDGSAVLRDSYSKHLEVTWDGHGTEERAIPADMPLRKELAAFLGHLQGGPPPRSSAEDGCRIVQTIEEVRRLARLPS